MLARSRRYGRSSPRTSRHASRKPSRSFRSRYNPLSRAHVVGIAPPLINHRSMSNLASDEKTLADKIEKKKIEIERVQKRLTALHRTRWVHTAVGSCVAHSQSDRNSWTSLRSLKAKWKSFMMWDVCLSTQLSHPRSRTSSSSGTWPISSIRLTSTTAWSRTSSRFCCVVRLDYRDSLALQETENALKRMQQRLREV